VADGVSEKDFNEIWHIESDVSALPDPACADKGFRSRSHLFIALKRRLDLEKIGLRLFAAGDEAFVWDVYALGRSGGLGTQEISVFAPYFGARRVICVHCRSYTDDCKSTIATCSGCGAALLVRDHFSKRLNAYQGFQIDAEEPGAVPKGEPFTS